MITFYFIGLLIVNSLLLLWFFSPIKNTIGKIIFKKDLMPTEFDDLLFTKNKFLCKLSSCWICCSYWLSLAVGAFFMLCFSLPFYWPFLTYFTYPAFCYLFYTSIRR